MIPLSFEIPLQRHCKLFSVLIYCNKIGFRYKYMLNVQHFRLATNIAFWPILLSTLGPQVHPIKVPDKVIFLRKQHVTKYRGMTNIGVASFFQGSVLQKLDETVINCYHNVSIYIHLHVTYTAIWWVVPVEKELLTLLKHLSSLCPPPPAPRHRDIVIVYVSPWHCERNFDTVRRNFVIFGRIISPDI